jgi:hypothetical protein
MTGAITFQSKAQQSSVAGVAGQATAVKSTGDQPVVSGETVTIGENPPGPGPNNPCLIGNHSIGGDADKAAARQRVSDYFKADEAYDKKMYEELGMATKRDADGFLDSDDEGAADKLIEQMMGGDSSGFDKMTQALATQIDHMKGVTAPPELKDYHAKVIAENEGVLAATKELKPMLDFVGAIVASNGDFEKIDMEKFGPMLMKLIASGGDPEKMLGEHAAALTKDGTLKAERKALCEQYGVVPGSWN